MFTSRFDNLTCPPEGVTLRGDGVDETVEGEMSGV